MTPRLAGSWGPHFLLEPAEGFLAIPVSLLSRRDPRSGMGRDAKVEGDGRLAREEAAPG